MAKRNLIINCDCLEEVCGSLQFQQDRDGMIHIDYYTSVKAEGRISRALKAMFLILLGREHALWGVVITDNNQIQRLKNFVADLKYHQ